MEAEVSASSATTLGSCAPYPASARPYASRCESSLIDATSHPGLDLRYAYRGTRDRNDWERFFLYVHARGAYAMTYPKGLFGTSDVLVQVGPGVDYFTRLRHFSIGFALDYVYATKAKASGFAAYPTVRYTF